MTVFLGGGGGSASYVKSVETQSRETEEERMQGKAFCLQELAISK
jgi:hypothetical protein